MTTLKPLGCNLIIRRAKSSEMTTKSGLLVSAMPGVSRRGVVLAVGPGRLLSTGAVFPCAVAPGDVVIWSDIVDGSPVNVDGEELLVVSEDAVVAIVRTEVS